MVSAERLRLDEADTETRQAIAAAATTAGRMAWPCQ